MRRPFIMATAVALSLAGLAGGKPAAAQPFLFQSSTKLSCWEDTAGFDVNMQPIPLTGPASPVNFSHPTESSHFVLITFNADGTVAIQGQASTIRPTATNVFAESTFNCTGTAAFNPSTLTVTVTTTSCTFQDTLPAASTGTTSGSQAIYKVTQGIGLQVTAAHPPSVETVSVVTGPNAPFSFQRICTSAGSAGELLSP